MREFHYVSCRSLEEAAEYLNDKKEKCKVVAGGTDVLVDLKNKTIKPELIVDISKIPGMNYIKNESGYIVLGALATHYDVTQSELIRKYANVLAEACAKVGSPQIRNMGTVAGNVINAQPAADAAVALHALEAELKIWQGASERWLPISDAYIGIGKSALAGQLVEAIRFLPLTMSQGSSFKRIARRESLCLPMLNAAVVVGIQNNMFTGVRIVVAPAGPVPMRVKTAEQDLEGKKVEEKVIQEAGAIVSSEANPRDSLFRGKREYRKEVVSSLICEALEEASQEVIQRQ